jgi:hypothetical protein
MCHLFNHWRWMLYFWSFFAEYITTIAKNSSPQSEWYLQIGWIPCLEDGDPKLPNGLQFFFLSVCLFVLFNLLCKCVCMFDKFTRINRSATFYYDKVSGFKCWLSFNRSIEPFHRSYNLMCTFKCNDKYHRWCDTRRECDRTFYVCAFLITNFCVHASDWRNESSVSVSAICQYAQNLLFENARISQFQGLSSERRSFLRYWSVTCMNQYWSVMHSQNVNDELIMNHE